MQLLAKWMTAFSEIYGKEITKERIQLYAGLLADVPVEELDVALRITAQECKNFPTIADIRGFIKKQVVAVEQFEAEKAWDFIRWAVHQFWNADSGILPHSSSVPNPKWLQRYESELQVEQFRGGYLIKPKPFSANLDFAIRQVGGLARIWDLAANEHDFVRRDFIQAFMRFKETGGYLAPTRQEALAMMDRINEKLLEEQS